MAESIPTSEPSAIVAGDTSKWSAGQSSEYPISDGWLLTYSFRGPSDMDLGASVITPGSDTYAVIIPAATTANLTAGLYQWASYVSKGTERHRLATGTLTVYADLSTVASTASFEERELALVEQAILDITESGVASLQLNGRAANKLDLPTLYKRRQTLRATLNARRTGSFMQPVQVHFVRP